MDTKNIKSLTTNTEETNIPEEELECAVCLQVCVHPVRLPCSHIFCFLCVKGVANQSKRCAMCRQEIPTDFLDNPILLKKIEEKESDSEGYQWFYEGRNGWWQYDERTSRDLENAFSGGERVFEVLVAGFLYSVDFDRMVQQRRNDPSRRRRIKRDLASIPKKGVAGLKTNFRNNDHRSGGTNGPFLERSTSEEASPPPPPHPEGALPARTSSAEPRSESATSELDYLQLLHSDLHRNLYFGFRSEFPRGECRRSTDGGSQPNVRSVGGGSTTTTSENPDDRRPHTPSNDGGLSESYHETDEVEDISNHIYNLTLQNEDEEPHFYSLDDTEEYNLPTNTEDL